MHRPRRLECLLTSSTLKKEEAAARWGQGHPAVEDGAVRVDSTHAQFTVVQK